MTHPAKIADCSAEDYLRWEMEQKEKHEYFQGEVVAMVGATRQHVTIAGNLFTLISMQLRGTGCRAYMSDMKLRVDAANAFFYPDLLVTCDAADHISENHLSAPVLVVEVLSPSTEAYDRGEKFAAYRLIQSLKEYALIDPDTRRIEIYRLAADRRWYLLEPDVAGDFELESIDLRVSSSRIFENV